ncbi:scavenger receptor cysteine-rich domain-containing protein DMBT1-like isoform X2 [Narcine bancroftii]|uniref:scavenger receptor cysteine-rich domain-containing protein DMBT1-like isoform X2 n=1 Tax=Narcine bancroftii TaxID=1343680 RepID=UPI00383122A7
MPSRGNSENRVITGLFPSCVIPFPSFKLSHVTEGSFMMRLCLVFYVVLLVAHESVASEDSENLVLRLVDGDSMCSGRVEVFYNNTWGTICDDYWDVADAVVVCRQLNCGFAESARGSSQFGEGLDDIWLDDVECVGSEGNLRQCKLRPIGDHNCNHVEDAGVICNPEQPPKPAIYSGKSSGVFIRGENLTIKCTTQGFYTSTMFYLFSSRGNDPVATKTPTSRHHTATFVFTNITEKHKGNYSCSYDSEISGRTFRSGRSENMNIMLKEFLPQPHLMHSHLATVIVAGQDISLRCEAPERYNKCIFHLFKDSEANVISSQLADERSAQVEFNITGVGKSNEGSYLCKYEVVSSESLHFNSSLSQGLNISVEDGVALRLVNDECNGEVEVYYNGSWGKVCGNGWRLSEARVVCRQLGCGFARSAAAKGRYSASLNKVQLNYVHCLGTEALLWNCVSLSWTDSTCFGYYRAEAACSDQPLQPSIAVFRSPSVYMPGENVTVQCKIPAGYVGRQVFLHRDGEKMSLLSLPVPEKKKVVNFTIANIQSRQSGNYSCSYDIDVSELVFNSEQSDQQTITVKDEPPEPQLSVKKDPPRYLPGQEISLQCKAPVYFEVSKYYLYKDDGKNYISSLSVSEKKEPAVFIIPVEGNEEGGDYTCQYETNSTGELHNSSHSTPVKISVVNDIRLRLVDGLEPCSGRVECFINGTWRTVCDLNWDLPDADVACRQLHCGFAQSATQSGRFREGTGLAWADNFNCKGMEAYLWVCPHDSVHSNFCPMRNDAGVICSDQPLKPKINFRRLMGEFSQGENLTIVCSSLEFYTGAVFYLYWTGKSTHVKSLRVAPTSSQVTFVIPGIDLSHSGGYTCAYQLERDGRNYTSAKSDEIRVTIIDKPPKPTIEILRPSGVFSIGETVGIRCRAPGMYAGVVFILSKVEGSSYITAAKAKTPDSSGLLKIRDIRLKDQGVYVCLYQITRAGKVYDSAQSERKHLTVSDELQSPQVSLNRPFGQYLQGQTAEITCIAPKEYNSNTFSLSKLGDTNVIMSIGPITNRTSVLTIQQIDKNKEGSYSCTYKTTISNKVYTSARSEFINISLTCEPQGAKLTLTTLFGLYIQGKSVRITCIAPEYYTTHNFHLIKDGQDTQMAWIPAQWTTHGAEYRIPNVSVSDSGNYTCTYETEINGKIFNSTYSNFVVMEVAERVEIRLINGTHGCAGRVEVMNNRTWGTVCDDQWDLNDGHVVCRELGCGHAILAKTHAYFGPGTGSITLDDLECQGSELFLWQCPSRHWGVHNCNHNEDAGVVCSGPKPRLSLSPDYDVFTKGDAVTFKCSIQRHKANKRLEFLRNSVYLSHEELKPEDVSATFSLKDIAEGDQGYYSCRYTYLLGSEWIHSTASDPVPLTLSDTPSSRRRQLAGALNRKGIIGLCAGVIIACVMGLLLANRYRKSGYIWDRKAGSQVQNLQPLITNQEEQEHGIDDEDSSI